MRISYKEQVITKRNVRFAVRRIFETYKRAWKMRYNVFPMMTGKQRSGLADALLEIGEEKVIHLAVVRFLKDDSAKKVTHSFSWFLAVMNNYMVEEVLNDGSKNNRRLSKQGDSEFEDEIKKAKTRRANRGKTDC